MKMNKVKRVGAELVKINKVKRKRVGADLEINRTRFFDIPITTIIVNLGELLVIVIGKYKVILYSEQAQVQKYEN